MCSPLSGSLNRPSELAKCISKIRGPFFDAASCAVTGPRDAMEDAHAMTFFSSTKTAIFGIFDGHGGSIASKFVAQHLPNALHDALIKLRMKYHPQSPPTSELEKLITTTFVELDRRCLTKCFAQDPGDNQCETCGTTATVVFLEQTSPKTARCIICNVGDSRCLVIRRGADLRFETKDHKPGDAGEVQRITAAGDLYQVDHGRISGVLGVSRSFGDKPYKSKKVDPVKDAIIAVPKIDVVELTADDVLVLGCDGVFDGFTYRTPQIVAHVDAKIFGSSSSSPSSSSNKSPTSSLSPPRGHSPGSATASFVPNSSPFTSASNSNSATAAASGSSNSSSGSSSHSPSPTGIAAASPSLATVCAEMCHRANNSGSNDNISSMIIRLFSAPPSPPTTTLGDSPNSNRTSSPLSSSTKRKPKHSSSKPHSHHPSSSPITHPPPPAAVVEEKMFVAGPLPEFGNTWVLFKEAAESVGAKPEPAVEKRIRFLRATQSISYSSSSSSSGQAPSAQLLDASTSGNPGPLQKETTVAGLQDGGADSSSSASNSNSFLASSKNPRRLSDTQLPPHLLSSSSINSSSASINSSNNNNSSSLNESGEVNPLKEFTQEEVDLLACEQNALQLANEYFRLLGVLPRFNASNSHFSSSAGNATSNSASSNNNKEYASNNSTLTSTSGNNAGSGNGTGTNHNNNSSSTGDSLSLILDRNGIKAEDVYDIEGNPTLTDKCWSEMLISHCENSSFLSSRMNSSAMTPQQQHFLASSHSGSASGSGVGSSSPAVDPIAAFASFAPPSSQLGSSSASSASAERQNTNNRSPTSQRQSMANVNEMSWSNVNNHPGGFVPISSAPNVLGDSTAALQQQQQQSGVFNESHSASVTENMLNLLSQQQANDTDDDDDGQDDDDDNNNAKLGGTNTVQDDNLDDDDDALAGHVTSLAQDDDDEDPLSAPVRRK